MGKLVEELKRRKVFRIAAVYAVVAWLLIQIADTVMPALQMPQWTVSFVTILFILGFPIALILAWAYEVTPEGIKTDSGKPSQTTTVRHTDQTLIYATFVLVLVVAGFQITDRLILDSPESNSVPTVYSGSDSERPTIRSSINIGLIFDGNLGIQSWPAISPDGSRLAYIKYLEDGQRLFVHELENLEARELIRLSSSSTSIPFFSPDGQQIAIRDDNKLMRVSVSGDSPQTLVDGLQESVVSWESNRNILYTDIDDRSLNRVAAVGGIPQKLELNIPSAEQQLLPHVLPGGEALLYNEAAGRIVTRGIRLAIVETGEVRTLIERGYAGRYAASGHIVFMRASTLWAVPFDLERLEISGPEVPVIQGIQTRSAQGLASFSFSNNGRLVYLPGGDIFGGEPEIELVWIDRIGNEEPLGLAPNQYSQPQISPNGEFLSLNVPDGNGNSDIWVHDLTSGVLNRRTFSGAAESAIWTPDGENLVFGIRENGWGIWTIAANGSGQPTLLMQEDDVLRAETFSPDSNQFIYRKGTGGPILYSSSMDGNRSPQPLFTDSTRAVAVGSTISPDGDWIAYQSFESGEWEVYVRPYPNVNEGKWQVTSEGGLQPHWGPEGKELYYFSSGSPLNRQIRAVSVDTESGFTVGTATTLFSGDFSGLGNFGGGVMGYDVTPDGQKFLMSKIIRTPVESTGPVMLSLVLVENWFDELSRLAPADPQ